MQLLIAVALSQIGKPYLWGHGHPSSGYDCSGFIQYLYDTIGMSPPVDSTAQGLYDYYTNRPGTQMGTIKPGSLVFYGPAINKITHIALVLDTNGGGRVIEAAGGDSSFTLISTEQQANKRAGVRIRPIKYRKDYLTAIYPSYACIGLI